MKKVLLILIDALTSRVITPLILEGELPHFRQLVDRGYYHPECISIFPSITHACLSSIATGEYPRNHGVLGSHWYIEEDQEIAYYGVGSNIILNKGIDSFIEEFVYKLNHERLSADTLFQKVEKQGLEAASLNFLIFRGDHEHTFNPPFPMDLLPNVPRSLKVQGPRNLWLGSFVQDSHLGLEAPNLIPNPTNWYGFEDKSTFELLIQLAKQGNFPDLTVAYFGENDFISHDFGPENTVDNLKQLDTYLGELFDAAGGIESLLSELCLIITGDHSHDSIRDEPGLAIISLGELLSDYELSEVGYGWEDPDELMICTNMRAAQIYFHQPQPDRIHEVIDKLIPDDRIDLIIGKAAVLNKGRGYCIASKPGQEIVQFWRGEEGLDTAVDDHGNQWSWTGDLSIVDGQVKDGHLTFYNYPNAFERIEGVLESKHSGQLWLSAAPGFEFAYTSAATHVGGGSHGALHRSDSVVPLLVASPPATFEMPAHPRIVDITPICLSILGQ